MILKRLLLSILPILFTSSMTFAKPAIDKANLKTSAKWTPASLKVVFGKLLALERQRTGSEKVPGTFSSSLDILSTTETWVDFMSECLAEENSSGWRGRLAEQIEKYGDSAEPAKVPSYVRDLASPQEETRVAAQGKLVALGEKAASEVQKALQSKDPLVVNGANAILEISGSQVAESLGDCLEYSTNLMGTSLWAGGPPEHIKKILECKKDLSAKIDSHHPILMAFFGESSAMAGAPTALPLHQTFVRMRAHLNLMGNTGPNAVDPEHLLGTTLEEILGCLSDPAKSDVELATCIRVSKRKFPQALFSKAFPKYSRVLCADL